MGDVYEVSHLKWWGMDDAGIIIVIVFMFRVQTQDPAQHHRLQQECLCCDEYFLAPEGRTNSVAGLVLAITYQFFQEETPALAKKVRDFAVETLGMGFSLDLLRDIMAVIRRQSDLLKLYQNYMAEVGCELWIDGEKDEELMETAAEGNVDEQQKSSIRDYLGERIATGQTQKTMHSEIVELDNASLLHTSSSQLSQLLNRSFRNPSSRGDRQQNGQRDSSQELQDFEKKGENVLGSDIETLMQKEMELDLIRQTNLHRSNSKMMEVEQYRYNRMIKDSLMKGKLRRRKK